jgi:hypothetical protein
MQSSLWKLEIEFNNIKNNWWKTKEKKLFLVDDDAVFLKSLEIEFIHHTDFIVWKHMRPVNFV